MTHQNEYDIKPLSPENRKQLKRQLLSLIAFGVFIGGIFFMIYKLVLSAGDMGQVPVFVFGVIAFIFSVCISFFFWNTYIDLKKGIKLCYTGFVTDKRIDKHTSSSARHNNGGSHAYGSSRKTTQTHYYVTVENKAHSVSYNHYLQTQVGDKVYLEVSPKKKEILAFTVLEKHNKIIDLPDYEMTKKSVKHNQKFVSMTQKEIVLVKRLFFKTIRKNLMYLIPIIILLFVLWKGLFIFLIPLIIAFIYFTFKILVQLNRYAKFNRNGCLKTVTKTQVIDKLKITSNKSTTKFQLETTIGNIEVTAPIYNLIQNSEIIYLHKASFLNVLYNISFDDKAQKNKDNL